MHETMKKQYAELAVHMLNLDAAELATLEGLAQSPHLHRASALCSWLRCLVASLRQRRAAGNAAGAAGQTQFPTPDFANWCADESADNLLGAMSLVESLIVGRLHDVALIVLRLMAVNAAACLFQRDIASRN